MGNYKQRDSFGGKKRYNNDRSSGRGGRGDRPQMHRVVCSDCGKSCEVPFRPTGDKPVFCSDCFSGKESSGGRRDRRRPSGRSNFGEKRMFKATCDKCHKDCEVPFRPSSDKPVYCDDCFERPERSSGGRSGGLESFNKQFEMLNDKLDNILEMLSTQPGTKKTAKKEKSGAKVEKKETKEKKVVAKKKAAVTKKVVKKAAPKKVVKKAPVKKVVKKAAPKKVAKKITTKKKK